MTSLGFLIVEDNFSSNFILYLGNIGLTIASIVTIYTGYIYFKKKFKVILMKKIFGIVGWSGSGKTDLVCRLIQAFKKSNISVGSIKHTHHNF